MKTDNTKNPLFLHTSYQLATGHQLSVSNVKLLKLSNRHFLNMYEAIKMKKHAKDLVNFYLLATGDGYIVT